jgi:MFS family permease
MQIRDPPRRRHGGRAHVSAAPRGAALAPFQVRSFRFQWPADLAVSWAFDMETLILGWYVLVETRSVLMLTVFASLQHIGTLIAPMFGVMGDRLGRRNVLCAMRAIYLTLALILMTAAYTDALTPMLVMTVAGVLGLVRPSDIGMRTAVVADIMPPARLLGAMGIQRMTQDSAKVIGALSGAGLVATLGMGPAYTVVVSLYAISLCLTFQAGRIPVATVPSAGKVEQLSPWRDLKEGMVYVWRTPYLLGAMCLAFLLNLTAFPVMGGLLPYVAKEIYHADQQVLGYMVAGAASGALLGSITVSRLRGTIHPARMMIVFCAVWYVVLAVFAQIQHPFAGVCVLVLAGCSQGLSQVPMATMLLRNSDAKYRGRIMGIRMLALYGNIPGLLIAGPLIGAIGYPPTATLYCVFGLVMTVLIAVHWRAHLWRLDAPANAR